MNENIMDKDFLFEEHSDEIKTPVDGNDFYKSNVHAKG